MKNEIINKLSNITTKATFQVQKHSPEILMGVGIIGTIASTVLACKATTKVSKIIDEKNQQINNVHVCLEDNDVEYNEDDSKKDLTIIYAQTGLKLIKLYAPAIIIGTLLL